MRQDCMRLGISQISGSSVSPGGYTERTRSGEAAQFQVGDQAAGPDHVRPVPARLPAELLHRLLPLRTHRRRLHGPPPSPAPSASFASPTRYSRSSTYRLRVGRDAQGGEQVIAKTLQTIPDETIRRQTIERLAKMDAGERDAYY